MMDKKNDQAMNSLPGTDGGGRTKKRAGGAGKAKALVDCCRSLTPHVLEQVNDVLKNGKDTDRLKAAELILTYGWGKPAQPAENRDTEGGPAVTGDLALVEARIRELLAKYRPEG